MHLDLMLQQTIRHSPDASAGWHFAPACEYRGHSISSFHLCGAAGFLSSVLVGLFVSWRHELPLGLFALLVASSVATFLAFALATKVVTGREELVYFRHEVAILLVAAALSSLLGHPLLAVLEVTLLGVGAFLALGRVGCFLVGCCYGCPYPFGVRYHDAHVAAGFPEELVGIRLLPVQLLEALAVALIVGVGLGIVWGGAAPGEALAWHTIAYGVVRFALEFFRGDSARPYFGCFSEAQWFTLLTMLLTTAAELTQLLPLVSWHVAVTAALALFMVAWAATENFQRRLFRAPHVRELAALMTAAEKLSREKATLHVGETRVGLKLSVCYSHQDGAEGAVTVAFSAVNRELCPSTATRLARLLSRLKGKPGQLIEGRSGVYHLVFAEDGASHGV